MDHPGQFQLNTGIEVVEGWLTKAPVVIDGYGGWNKVARPRRKSLTEWIGRNGVSIQIEFLFDNFIEQYGYDNETMCRRLERIAGSTDMYNSPQLFTVTANPAPLMPYGLHRDPGLKFFIETGPQWNADGIIYNKYGNRTRAGGTMVISEFVEDQTIEELPRRKKKKKQKAKHKWHVVKSGETLRSIAAKELGSADRWQEIAKKNKIRDPKKIRVGQKLRMP